MLPPAKLDWSLRARWREFWKSPLDKSTGLEHLSLDEFMLVKRATKAFAFATESNLKEGWWSSLLSHPLLTSRPGVALVEYLRRAMEGKHVVEIGPGDMTAEHRIAVTRFLRAASYTAVDLNPIVTSLGGRQIDALQFLGGMPSGSIDVIMAFGVLNEPMSLQYPAWAPPQMRLPARTPAMAKRAHAEHEYVRRLARAMHDTLSPAGLLFGDGLHSRRFERDVETYLRRTGLTPDAKGMTALTGLDWNAFGIRDPFFLTKE